MSFPKKSQKEINVRSKSDFDSKLIGIQEDRWSEDASGDLTKK